MLGVHCSSGFSLAAASRSCSCCSVWASHAVEHGLWGMGASVLGTTRLWSTGSIVVAHTGSTKLWHLVAPQHMGSSQIRDRTHVSCIGRWILYHWATREAPVLSILTQDNLSVMLQRVKLRWTLQRHFLMPNVCFDAFLIMQSFMKHSCFVMVNDQGEI